MKLSACMIVKNEEKTLALTLPELSRGVDEIILVDTGSSDGTVALAQKYGARVCHFAWVNDFAAARNESLKYATGDWILWIDADEYLSAAELQRLRAELENSPAEAHVLTIHESEYGQCEQRFHYQRAKVFRNGRGCRFERPINEQLVDAAGRLVTGPEVPVGIYHWGRHLESGRLADKRKRYVELYSKALEQNPDDPQFHFLLANAYRDLEQLAPAVEHYRQASRLARDPELTRQALELTAQTLLQMNQLKEAGQAAKALMDYDRDNITARNIFATLFIFSRKAETAIEVLNETLEKAEQPGTAGNPYQVKWLPNYLLGKAYELKGEPDKAQAYYTRAHELYPYSEEGN